MENYSFLINSVLATLISGVLLTLIGNYILYNFSNEEAINLLTCDQKILDEANSRKGNNGYNGYIFSFTGYIVTAMGLLFLIIFSTFLSTNNKKGTSENLQNIIVGNIPIFLSLLVVSYIIILNVNYKDSLVAGKVSNEFFSYLLFFSLFFLGQIATVSKYIVALNNKVYEQHSSVIYALSLANILLISVMNIILAFFSTDG